jgi:hypothetical protein
MKKVLIVLLGVVFAFVVFVATRPATYHIERSATIAAPPSMVYAHVENVRMWEAWSPWEELDPEMEKTYEGPESGVGAGYAWAGNDQVGEGRAIIIEAEPNEKVVSDLEFIKPWERTGGREGADDQGLRARSWWKLLRIQGEARRLSGSSSRGTQVSKH